MLARTLRRPITAQHEIPSWSFVVILTNCNTNQRILHHCRATAFKYNTDRLFYSEITR